MHVDYKLRMKMLCVKRAYTAAVGNLFVLECERTEHLLSMRHSSARPHALKKQPINCLLTKIQIYAWRNLRHCGAPQTQNVSQIQTKAVKFTSTRNIKLQK